MGTVAQPCIKGTPPLGPADGRQYCPSFNLAISAEEEGFEPPVGVTPLRFSRPLPSTTRPLLQRPPVLSIEERSASTGPCSAPVPSRGQRQRRTVHSDVPQRLDPARLPQSSEQPRASPQIHNHPSMGNGTDHWPCRTPNPERQKHRCHQKTHGTEERKSPRFACSNGNHYGSPHRWHNGTQTRR